MMTTRVLALWAILLFTPALPVFADDLKITTIDVAPWASFDPATHRAVGFFPAVVAEIERRMGFPRDYLDFTTWYLAKKGYIVRADNSDFTLTAEGVDYIETQRASLPVLNKLLTDASAY